MARSESDKRELEAHLAAMRDALARARNALKEASAAERVLAARIAETSIEDLGAFPSVEEPTVLTTEHALRKMRKDTLFIGLGGAGIALATILVTLLVMNALRPKAVPAAVAAPLPSPIVAAPPVAEPPVAEPPTEPTPPTEASAHAPSPAAPTSAAALKPADDCASRTYVDARGVKHYKPHCLGF